MSTFKNNINKDNKNVETQRQKEKNAVNIFLVIDGRH